MTKGIAGRGNYDIGNRFRLHQGENKPEIFLFRLPTKRERCTFLADFPRAIFEWPDQYQTLTEFMGANLFETKISSDYVIGHTKGYFAGLLAVHGLNFGFGVTVICTRKFIGEEKVEELIDRFTKSRRNFRIPRRKTVSGSWGEIIS